MRKNMTISMTAGIVLSAAALYLAFRNVRFAELTDYFFRIQYAWAFPALFLMFISFVFRVVRWQIILSSTNRIPFWRAFHPTLIGFMLNCILPARIGEIARPAILKSRDDVPFATGLATVAAERVFDLLMLIASFAIVMMNVNIDPAASHVFGKYTLNRETLAAVNRNMIIMSLVLVAGILIVAVNATRLWINKRIMACPDLLFWTRMDFRNRIRHSVCRRLCELIDNIAQGFTLIKEPVKTLECILLSMIIWILLALSYHLMAMGFPGFRLSFMEMFAVMIIVCFFIALPSVPGFWGLWEAGGVFAMSVFGVPEKEALGFSLVNHAVQMFPVIFIGLVSAFIYGINFAQLRRLSRDAAENKSMDVITP